MGHGEVVAPSGSADLANHQVRELFASLGTVTRLVVAEGERRIPDITGFDPSICIHRETVKDLTDTRLGTFDVMRVIHMEAGVPLDDQCLRLAIGVHCDGSIEVTPNFNTATHLEWKR